MAKELLAKSIAGEVTLSKEPGKVMKKWREIFGVKQSELASSLGISPSVISDYEAARRKSPGIKFVKKFIDSLIRYDLANKQEVIEKFSLKREESILDLREFLTPIESSKLIKAVKGRVLSNEKLLQKKIFGYTVIDSIRAILDLQREDFWSLYGLNTQRALIFTNVKLGRSPLIAIKVTSPKPAMVVLHGLKPGKVDKLAIKISKLENIPLVVSELSEGKMIESLSRLEH